MTEQTPIQKLSQYLDEHCGDVAAVEAHLKRQLNQINEQAAIIAAARRELHATVVADRRRWLSDNGLSGTKAVPLAAKDLGVMPGVVYNALARKDR